MPKRKVAQCVILARVVKEGQPAQRIKLMPGDTFDFTAEELADINAVNRDAIETPKGDEPVKEVKLSSDNKGGSNKKASGDDTKDDL